MTDITMLRLKQQVRSTDPKDALQPRGFIFAFREGPKARVVFDDNSIRDVELKYLEPDVSDRDCFYCHRPLGDRPFYTVAQPGRREYCHKDCAERD